jgi:hypothetical protein
MKYYIILLLQGRVVGICTYDDEDSRDGYLIDFEYQLASMSGLAYNELQTLNEVA